MVPGRIELLRQPSRGRVLSLLVFLEGGGDCLTKLRSQELCCWLCRKEGEEAWQPEYGNLVWLMQHGLRLCAPRVMDSHERKAALLKTLIMLTTGGAARYTDPAILMEILYLMKGWLIDGIAGPGARMPKSVLEMQKC